MAVKQSLAVRDGSLERSGTRPSARPHLPLLIYVLAAGTFLMGTTELVVAGLLPEMAADFGTTVAQAGLAITAFAVGMIVGTPSMALLTLRLSRRLTLTLALLVFAAGHVVVAVTDSFAVMLAARCLTAFATGAFWAVATVVAARAVGPLASSRALGIVLGGGMLATVLGVPLGALAGQLIGWRGPFWVLAVLAVVLGVVVARAVPAEPAHQAGPSLRAELAGLRSPRLWLTLATCAGVNAGVLSIYSFVAPLLTDRTGLPGWMIPVALVLFGTGAMVGTIVGGRLGDSYPFGTALTTAATTVVVAGGLCLVSTLPVPTLVLFTVLGLVGLSANPVLVNLAVRYGGDAPTLASAMATSVFNLGTAVGTWVTGVALGGVLGALAPPMVGALFGVVVFLPLGTLALLEHRTRSPLTVNPQGT